MKIIIESGEAYPTFWVREASLQDLAGWFYDIVDVPDEQVHKWLEAERTYREVQREIEVVSDDYWRKWRKRNTAKAQAAEDSLL